MLVFFVGIAAQGWVACTGPRAAVTVPAGSSVEVAYPGYERFDAQVRNRSRETIAVGVLEPQGQEPVRGFGLEGRQQATVWVEGRNRLRLYNPSSQPARVKVAVRELVLQSAAAEPDDYVEFTLQNTTAQPIPLLIPGVMNPNLSPFSQSGVSLKVGQEILFRQGGRKYVLLTVDGSIQPGEEVDVAQRLEARKKELGL